MQNWLLQIWKFSNLYLHCTSERQRYRKNMNKVIKVLQNNKCNQLEEWKIKSEGPRRRRRRRRSGRSTSKRDITTTSIRESLRRTLLSTRPTNTLQTTERLRWKSNFKEQNQVRRHCSKSIIENKVNFCNHSFLFPPTTDHQPTLLTLA